jgi:hypothetical protein
MPNGREVVFLDGDSPHAAFIVAADGGEAPRRILETELSRTIWAASAIHPEGRISVIAPGKNIPGGVFFVADRTNSRLIAVDKARYSPDSRWVSFVAQRMQNPGTVEIGIVAADSNRATTWTRILENHPWPDKPRWSPNGRRLYFLSRGADGYFNLWGVPIDPARGAQTGKPSQVTYFSSPDWHIDRDMGDVEIDLASGRLVLPMQNVKGSIWLLSGVSR